MHLLKSYRLLAMRGRYLGWVKNHYSASPKGILNMAIEMKDFFLVIKRLGLDCENNVRT